MQQEYNRRFEKRCRELVEFKEEFGHFDVPQRFANNPSLGRWCGDMRGEYKKNQEGMRTKYNLSKDRIDRLEEIGFLWQGVNLTKNDKRTSVIYDKAFEKHCNGLVAFIEKHGHSNVPQRCPINLKLGQWCNKTRTAYKKIQKGEETIRNLSQDMIKRLEAIGFQWQGIDRDDAFEKRCRELIAYKEEHGDCNVPQRKGSNSSLGHWCNKMRTAYKKIQKGEETKSDLSQDRIDRLDVIGFKW